MKLQIIYVALGVIKDVCLNRVHAYADIIKERLRATALGYTGEHDDSHDKGELVQAAMYYLKPSTSAWPWIGPSDKTPDVDNMTSRNRCVKAVACLIAEIERLDHLK